MVCILVLVMFDKLHRHGTDPSYCINNKLVRHTGCWYMYLLHRRAAKAQTNIASMEVDKYAYKKKDLTPRWIRQNGHLKVTFTHM